MKTTNTTTTTTTTAASRKPVKPVKSAKKCVAQSKRPSLAKKLHPAEAAGMTVHQKLEAGVATVRDTIYTVGTYGMKFIAGLVKGH